MLGRGLALVIACAVLTTSCGWIQDQAAEPVDSGRSSATQASELADVAGTTDSAGTGGTSDPTTSVAGPGQTTPGSPTDPSEPSNLTTPGGTLPVGSLPDSATRPDGGAGPGYVYDPELGIVVPATTTTIPLDQLPAACTDFVRLKESAPKLNTAAQFGSVGDMIAVLVDSRALVASLRANAPSTAVRLVADRIYNDSRELIDGLRFANDTSAAEALIQAWQSRSQPSFDTLVDSLRIFCPNMP